LDNQEFDNEGRVLTLEYPNYYLINAYFPHSGRNLERLDFKLRFNKVVEFFCKQLETKKPIIILGDFNVAHKEIDLANPKENKKNAGFTFEERNWFNNFIENYIDTFRIFNTTKGNYTWWAYRNNCRARNIGWRIDYFIVSKILEKNIESSLILKDVFGSDHCPIELKTKHI
jgi:exodeoxyribonuclease-3